jgi:transcriptional regulator with XRE-family HTH domain
VGGWRFGAIGEIQQSKKYLDKRVTSWQYICAMINERIKKLMRARGWKIKDLAEEIERLSPAQKIHQSQLSRMLAGKRQWLMPHLELVAKALRVQIGDLADETVTIPVVAEISAIHECQYPGKVEEPQIIGYLPLPRIIAENKDWPMPEDLYGLRVQDNSFEPALFKNAQLIVQRNGEKREEDLVVYCDQSNRIFLGRLFFHNDHLLLRSLNPAAQKDMILPRRHLSSMDRIIAQIFI